MTQNPRSQPDAARPGHEQPDAEQPAAARPGHEHPDAEQRCPCGSGETYAACCARFHLGAPAPTAEALMRSRYSANALLSRDPAFFAGYLHRTWAAETRPALRDLTAPGPQWRRLNILGATAGGPFHDTGTVEFVAAYEEAPDSDAQADRRSTRGRLHELSRFRREAGQWLYVDGDVG